MIRILSLVALIASSSLASVAQENNFSQHRIFAMSFVKSIDSTSAIEELAKHFNKSLNPDTLLKKLKHLKFEILKHKSTAQFYTMASKGSGSGFLVNVNLNDPETKTLFGDLRLHFTDETDFLIDKWVYIRWEDSRKEDSTDDLPNGQIPPPPPPPPPPRD